MKGVLAMERRKKSESKRTISPEQQAKMQAGRKAAAVHKRRVDELYKSGVAVTETMTRTEHMLNGVRRKGSR